MPVKLKTHLRKKAPVSESESESDSDFETVPTDDTGGDDEDDDDEEDEEEEEETEEEEQKPVRKRHNEKKKAHSAKRKSRRSETEDDDDEETENEDENPKQKPKKSQNLIFLLGGGRENDDEYEDDEYDTEELLEEDEQYNSDEEKTFMKEKYERLETPEEVSTPRKGKKKTATAAAKQGPATAPAAEETQPPIEEEYSQLMDTKKTLIQELRKRPGNKIYIKALKECNEDIKKLVRRGKKDNLKEYHELIKKGKNKHNEYTFFRKELSNTEQKHIISEMKRIYSTSHVNKPYRFAILESNVSPQLKSIVLGKIDQLNGMSAGDPEYAKIKNWIDAFMKIPFGIYKSVSISVEHDGIEASNIYMSNAQEILDKCVYGLKETKMQILQILGNWLTNPKAMGTAIAFEGPPGTGKTSLIKDGISKILGREFVFIPLGGAGDGSFLEGHSYTYEGSVWGKIVQSLMDCKCMNPIIYFDELDKVSDSARGQEIMGILTHLTDTTQNMQFHDKYFSEINEFDLSNCLFMFSFNDKANINPILLNRMTVIQTKGYSVDEKLVIARKYILPKIYEQVGLQENEVVLTDEILREIASNERYTKKEDGVRNLKRSLETIFKKINLFRVMKPDNEFFKTYTGIPTTITFPYTLTLQDLNLLVKNVDGANISLSMMYM